MTRASRNLILTAVTVAGSAGAVALAALSGADRAWLYAALGIVALVIVPFYIGFEKDRPRAGHVVLIAVMITLAVVGRAAFFWAPQFKPIIAVIIIAGVAMGGQSGFITGSMSAFVSNFIFGQGPWTPFQMLAWGLIGFFAGLLFHDRYMNISDTISGHGTGIEKEKDALKGEAYGKEESNTPELKNERSVVYTTKYKKEKSIIPVVIYGALSCFVLHGAITDIWTVLSISDRPVLGEIVTVYSAGLIPDLVLAVATVTFLLAMLRPMLKKFRRMREKYGII